MFSSLHGADGETHISSSSAERGKSQDHSWQEKEKKIDEPVDDDFPMGVSAAQAKTYQQEELQTPPRCGETSTSCPICLEDFDVEAGMEQVVVQVPVCGHSFCRACLRQHCQHSISGKNVPIPCPRSADKEEACEAKVPHDTVQNLLLDEQDEPDLTNRDKDDFKRNVEEWKTFQILSLKRQDSSLYRCPGCEELISVADTSCNDVTCTLCQVDFCLVHGTMHPGISCVKFQRTRQARAISKSERTLDRFTKPCSRCGCRIQKAAGCDYIICGHCRKDMCWSCGTHEYMTDDNNMRKCTQCKMKHHYANRQDRCLFYCLFLPLSVLLAVPLTVIYIALAIVISVATCFCGGCFGCGRFMLVDVVDDDGRVARKPGNSRHGICASLYLIFLPFSLPLQDAGILNCRTVDELFPLETGEIPFMAPTEESESATKEKGTENRVEL